MKDKPNILLFMSDQHNAAFMGCAGDKITRTAAIDSLAASGTRFENAYCGSPLCVPSRMTFLTGRHCHNINVWDNSGFLASDIPSFAHALGMAGYRTVLAGRMHFLGGDQLHGFQERLAGDLSPSFLGRNVACERDKGFFGMTPAVEIAGAGQSHDLNYDKHVASEACRLIYDHEAAGDPRPLLLVVSFFAPHGPFMVPEKYFKLYDGKHGLPRNFEANDPELPHYPSAIRRHGNFAAISPEAAKKARDAYSAKVHMLDDNILQVLEYFRSTGLAGDAMYVYTSDHGEMAGEHGIWAKSVFYESSVKVPLIISWPGHVPEGRTIKSPISLLDIAPTLVDIAGAPTLPDCDGVSLAGMLTGAQEKRNDPVFSEISSLAASGPCRMIRKGPWKAVFHEDCVPELYNMDDDPEETCCLHDTAVLSMLEEEVRKDGWDPDDVKKRIQSKAKDHSYLAKWAQTVDPHDPIQWGRYAAL